MRSRSVPRSAVRGSSVRGAAVLAAAVLAAAALPAALAATLEVRFARPSGQEALFGAVEVQVVATPVSEIARVELFVDGARVGERREPPYHFVADLGADNAEHRFEAVAHGLQGEVARAVVETPAIRIDHEVELELTELYLTVTDRGSTSEKGAAVDSGAAFDSGTALESENGTLASRRIDDLRQEDFTVFDQGKRQTLVTFARGTVPLTATLLVDGSDSMRGSRLALATRGARAFLSALQPLDQARLVVFSDRLLLATPFSGFEEVLTAGLDGLRPGGGTSLTDQLFAALRGLESKRGRRVVILLSDGADTTSVLRMREIEPFVRRSPALIYWIQLGNRVPVSSAWRDTAGHREEVERLARAVELSGGRVLPLGSLSEAGSAFAGILEELREQYVIGFYPSDDRDDGRWHRVRVSVDRPGVKARTREGYVDQ